MVLLGLFSVVSKAHGIQHLGQCHHCHTLQAMAEDDRDHMHNGSAQLRLYTCFR